MDIPEPQALRVTVDEGAGKAVVHVSGEVDVQSADELRGHLLLAAGSHRRLVLDLAGVTFLDSAGLGALVSAHRAADERGGSLVVTGARGMVREVLRASRLDTVLEVSDTTPPGRP